MNKPEMKKEYKRLIIAGQEKKAQEILEKLWNGKYEQVSSEKSKETKPKKKTQPKQAKPKTKKKDSLDSLDNIDGIGSKTLNDIKRIYSSVEELRKALDEDKVPLRNDIVTKLNKYLEDN